jgi:hypothetical protein
MKTQLILASMIATGILVGACGPKNEIPYEDESLDASHPVERVQPATSNVLSGVSQLLGFEPNEDKTVQLPLDGLAPVDMEPEQEDSSFQPARKVGQVAPQNKAVISEGYGQRWTGDFAPTLLPTSQADLVYQTYASRDGVFALSMETPLLNDLNADFDLDEATRYVQGKIDRMRVLILPEGERSKAWSKEIDRTLNGKPFKTVQPEIQGDDLEWVKLYRLEYGPIIPEVHILVMTEDHRAILVSAFGTLTIEE